jgi:DUF971 family protein
VPEEFIRDESLSPEQYRPVDLDLALPQQELRITWADGVSSVFPLAFLRRNCPCATCRTEREKQTTSLFPILSESQAKAGGATTTGAHLVGNYAIQLEWSDGHSTGIYDFKLLRSLHSAVAK